MICGLFTDVIRLTGTSRLPNIIIRYQISVTVFDLDRKFHLIFSNLKYPSNSWIVFFLENQPFQSSVLENNPEHHQENYKVESVSVGTAEIAVLKMLTLNGSRLSFVRLETIDKLYRNSLR